LSNDDQLGACLLAGGDVSSDPVAVRTSDQRAHVRLGAVSVGVGPAVAHLEGSGSLGHPSDEVVGDRLHGDQDADGHASLSGAAVAGVHRGVGGQVEIGVRQDDHVVLGAAERLYPLAVSARLLVHVLGDRRGAYEADGGDVGGVEKRIDGGLVALQDVEDAVGQTGFLPQSRHPQRR
jgi:hypothetical protein